MPEAVTDTNSSEDEACSECGLTRRKLYQQGQMGCAKCYETFAAEVKRALEEIHGETRHIGKNAA